MHCIAILQSAAVLRPPGWFLFDSTLPNKNQARVLFPETQREKVWKGPVGIDRNLTLEECANWRSCWFSSLVSHKGINCWYHHDCCMARVINSMTFHSSTIPHHTVWTIAAIVFWWKMESSQRRLYPIGGCVCKSDTGSTAQGRPSTLNQRSILHISPYIPSGL